MGYYSSYNLNIYVPTGTMISDQTIINSFREQCEEAEYALEKDGSTCQETKWYDCEVDMKSFSKSFPTALFVMKVRGEDGEESIIYARNGKSYEVEPRIIWPDFDPRRLG